jgi:hypothetical protein
MRRRLEELNAELREFQRVVAPLAKGDSPALLT